MNTVDIVILAIAAVAFVMGMSKGLVRELAGLIGIILGAFCAKHFSGVVAGWLLSYMENETMAKVVAFAGVLVIVVIAVHFLANLVSRLISLAALGIVNRLCGGVFSVLKIMFVLSCLLYVINRFGLLSVFVGEDQLAESKTYGLVSNFAKFAFPYIETGMEQINNVDVSDINL
ncbi:MAG: CvpA family protein [Bacteroidales bacterium]|nr:CvpA family protein [Bacteroidales bacterium]